MVYLKLFLTFMKIGLFSFGGGYAMIPLIQGEIASNGWLSSSEFIDIIAVAEMTPGPIAVNSATFVGYKAAGILGGAVATIGVALPSLLILLILSKYLFKYQKHPANTAVFYGIRPVIVALIITAAVFVAETAIFKDTSSINNIWSALMTKPLGIINIKSIIILAATLIVLLKYKINPIVAIIGSGGLGILLFYVL